MPPGRRPLFSLALIALFAGCATAPTAYVEPATPSAAERTALNSRVFNAAWERVNEKYFDPTFGGVDWPAMRAKYGPLAAVAQDEAALYRVLNQMTKESLDRHTSAISPRRVHAMRVRHLTHTGLKARWMEGRWVVFELVTGSPAATAGVKPGWIVVSCDGKPLPETLESDLFSGPAGVPIGYEFLDEEGRSRSLSIAPDLISFNDADRRDSQELANGIRYLRFDGFDRTRLGWFEQEIKTHRNAPGMILDLRNNSGGSGATLRNAVRAFFPTGRNLGHTVERSGKVRAMDTLSFRVPLYEGKVVILTSAKTASSAEIFSRALQFYQRAEIVGQTTAGVVRGSRKYSLPDGGSMNVTELDFRGPDGAQLEGVGVAPDILVPLTLADVRAGRDPALETALSLFRSDVARN